MQKKVKRKIYLREILRKHLNGATHALEYNLLKTHKLTVMKDRDRVIRMNNFHFFSVSIIVSCVIYTKKIYLCFIDTKLYIMGG